MDKIKEIYQHNGTDWGDAIPIGVDAEYVDVTDESSSVPLNNLIKDMTQEELQEFLGNLPSGIPADYVKKSGDTMTGSLYFTGANNQSVGLIVNNDGENLDCGWDYSNGGAGMALRSPNYGDSNARGDFDIYARSQADEAYTKHLIGKANGSLTWGGQNILTRTPNVKAVSNRNTANVTTSSTTGVDITSMSYTTNTGRYLVIGKATYSVDKNTANIKLFAGSTQLGYDLINNAVKPHDGTIFAVRTTTAGATETLSLKITAQDSSTTATLYAYTMYQIIAIDIPYIQ